MTTTLTPTEKPLTTTLLPERIASLVTSKNIDWEGNCTFDEAGKVVKFKRESIGNSFSMQPIPKDKDALVDASNGAAMLCAIMQPCSKKEFATIIKALSLHCGLQNKTPGEIKSILRDYWDDFGHYPKALIVQACAEYRQQNGTKYMPTSGCFLGLMAKKWRAMLLLKARLDKILGIYQPPKTKVSTAYSLDEVLENLF